MLIDCGSKEGASTNVMKDAIADLAETMLPDDNGKKRLDMIVVTHRHEDHIKGFDPNYFENIAIKNIWLTAAMNEEHPQAKRSMALHDFAAEQMQALADSGAALSPELEDLVALYGIQQPRARRRHLTETWPAENGIEAGIRASPARRPTTTVISIDRTPRSTVLAPERGHRRFLPGQGGR